MSKEKALLHLIPRIPEIVFQIADRTPQDLPEPTAFKIRHLTHGNRTIALLTAEMPTAQDAEYFSAYLQDLEALIGELVKPIFESMKAKP